MPWNDNSGNGDEPPKANGGPWGGGGSGGNGNGGSPWGRPSGGGNGGGQGGNNDIEEQMRRMQERFSRRGRGGGGGRGPSLGPGGFLVLGVVALVAWLATGVVMVDEGERAAVFRFGEYQKNFTPGLHVHLPAPIETHEILPSERQQETKVGSNPGEALMLTGDENIVELQFAVFWFYDGENPENFILNIDNGTPLVKAAAESVMREVVGKSTLDAVLTTGRGEIATTVREQLQVLLSDYGAGVTIENVEIQEALAPAPVRADFIDVINAGQDAERLVQEANRYANDIVPRARGEAQQILQVARCLARSAAAQRGAAHLPLPTTIGTVQRTP